MNEGMSRVTLDTEIRDKKNDFYLLLYTLGILLNNKYCVYG